MADGIHITRLAAHQITGPVAVIECKVFHQELAVHRIPHFVEYTLGTNFEIVRNHEAEYTSYCSYQKQYENKQGKLVVLPAADNIIYYFSADDRVNDGQPCQKCYEKQSQKEPFSVRLNKRIEPFHRCHLDIPSRMI